MLYLVGRENKNVDALSHRPQLPATAVGIAEEVQVSAVNAEDPCPADTPMLLKNLIPAGSVNPPDSFATEQIQDPLIKELFKFIERGWLPPDSTRARKITLQVSLFAIVGGILYYVNPKHGNRKQAIVPKQLQHRILEEAHSGPFGGHISGQWLYNSLVKHWYWEVMFSDAVKFAKACPECAVTTGTGRRTKPPLHPIPAQHPFKILGIDVMDLPLTEKGNRHVVVIQDLFTKWPFVFVVPDEKASRFARI